MEPIGFSQEGGAVSIRGRSFRGLHQQRLSCEFFKKCLKINNFATKSTTVPGVQSRCLVTFTGADRTGP